MCSEPKRLFWNAQRISCKFSDWIFFYLWLYCRSYLWGELKGGSGLLWIITNSAPNQVLTFTCCALCRPSFTPGRGSIPPVLWGHVWFCYETPCHKSQSHKQGNGFDDMCADGLFRDRSKKKVSQEYAEFPLIIAIKVSTHPPWILTDFLNRTAPALATLTFKPGPVCWRICVGGTERHNNTPEGGDGGSEIQRLTPHCNSRATCLALKPIISPHKATILGHIFIMDQSWTGDICSHKTTSHRSLMRMLFTSFFCNKCSLLRLSR